MEKQRVFFQLIDAEGSNLGRINVSDRNVHQMQKGDWISHSFWTQEESNEDAILSMFSDLGAEEYDYAFYVDARWWCRDEDGDYLTICIKEYY